MRIEFLLALAWLSLSLSGAEGTMAVERAMINDFAALAHQSPAVRSTVIVRLDGIPAHQVALSFDALLPLIKTDVACAVIDYLSLRDPSTIISLLPRCVSMEDPVVTATAINSIPPGSAEAVASLEPLLESKSEIVRTAAALKLVLRPDPSSDSLNAALSALASDLSFPFGDPPKPLWMATKVALRETSDRDRVLAAIHTRLQAPVSSRERYHLLDLASVLSGRSKQFRYGHTGEPTEKEKQDLEFEAGEK